MEKLPLESSCIDAAARVKQLYNVMQSVENRLGGGEGVEGLYGSINRSGMQKVVDCLREHCGLDASSHMVDIGAGLGRPLMHALVDPGIASACGVEIDRIKVDKAAAFLAQTIAELRRRGVLAAGQLEEAPAIRCSAVEGIKTLDPCTHAYSFWEGVPPEGKAAFGRLFAASRTLRAVAVVQRAMRAQPPAEVMWQLGFGRLALARSFSVSMSGSGRSFQCYVFNRVGQQHLLAGALPAPLPATADSVQTPSLPPAAEHGAAVSGLPLAAEDFEDDDVLSAPLAQATAAAADVLLPANGSSGSSAMRRSTRQRRPTAKAVTADKAVGSEEEGEGAKSTLSSSRVQRAARRAAAATATTATVSAAVGHVKAAVAAATASVAPTASRKQRGSPSKSSGGVSKKASPAKAATAGTKGASPSKAKAKSHGGLFGGTLASLRQQKAALPSGCKPVAAKEAADPAGSMPRRGLLGGLRAVTRSMQQALSPSAVRLEVAAGQGHAKGA